MTCSLFSLVDDVIIHILKALAVMDILSVRLTSKRLESLSRLTNVWYSIFIREVLIHGRPIPGYSIPRGLPPPSAGDAKQTRQKFSIIDAENLLESADLEARTLLALRLDKKWCKSGSSTPNSESNVITRKLAAAPTPSSTISNLFLVPGGRYLILVHVDGLRLWDLGFPASSPVFRDTHTTPSLVETWLVDRPDLAAPYNVTFDVATRASWVGKSKIFLSYCSGDQIAPRTISIVSLCHASLKLRNHEVDLDDDSDGATPASSAFNLEREIILPTSLPQPRDSGSTPGATGGNFGRLGKLILMHSKYLSFESFAPFPASVPAPPANTDQYVGIEMLDWTNPEPTANSTLLVYPGPEVGTFVSMHFQECTQHVIVVWRRCIGVYALRSCATTTNYIPGRVLSFPTIIFALAEEVTSPIAFTPCISSTDADLRSGAVRTGVNARFANLTIVAQPAARPRGTVHSILTTTRQTARGSGGNDDEGAGEYSFRLTRVPTRERFGGLAQMESLVLGLSGRGVRVEDDGSVYACSPSSMFIPSLQGCGVATGQGGGAAELGEEESSFLKGLVKTVDFWPYRKIADIESKGEVETGVEEEEVTNKDCKLKVCFDDGMGRVVYTRLSPASGGGSSVTILDFA